VNGLAIARIFFCLALTLVLIDQRDAQAQASAVAPSAVAPSDDLVGLWKARQWFGPYARGLLTIERTSDGWRADFVGRSLPVQARGAELSFELPSREGWFTGRLHPNGGAITGQWISPNSLVHGSLYASPVVLKAEGADRWRGSVVPRDDAFTLFLMVQRRPDGTLGAFMRNPDRNIGVFYDIDRLTRDGNAVRLIGHRLGDKTERVLLQGAYDSDNGLLSVAFPERGGAYDFRRDDEHSDFYPRGRSPDRYVYRTPPARDDGWPIGTLERADIDRAGMEKFVQMIIDMPIESVHTPEVHGVLIARHGQLVLEEYFHGEHRDKLHDTRSAAKSLTATLIGAAMHAGAPLRVSTPVYAAMNAGAFPANLDPQKRAMTLLHLLTMRSGYFCDDTNPAAPGNEDTMLDQTDEPDYYRYTLRLPLDRQPGEKGVYCSIDPNLALGVMSRASGEPAMDAFDRLLGEPLKISTYGWPLSPAKQPYGGGGVWLLPRDFMKLGQLMLEGGTWQGRRILDPDYAARAAAPLHDLRGIQYGYLWWSIEYPYKTRTVRAFFAGGNGGQLVMVVPELDLVIATYAGNYSDRVSLRIQQELVPNYILPAVREPGDDPKAPVLQRDFNTPYGRPSGP
jgi:CubicO group peptidase (beta-lactamase class C family)